MTVALYGIVVWLVALLLRGQWSVSLVWRWAGLTIAVLAYELWLLWHLLEQHHRPGESRLLPGLGIGNALTMFRGLAYGLLAGFLLTPWPIGFLAWLPALLYTLAGIADYFDGSLARKSNHATVLGEILDMEYDALGLLVAVTVAIHFGQLPAIFIIIGAARYLFVLGLALRCRQGKTIHDLMPSDIRRVLAGLQMGFLSVALWPITPPALATLAGGILAVPFLAVFTRDWLVVSGAIDPTSSRYLNLSEISTRVIAGWLPLAVRLLTAAAVTAMLLDASLDFETWASVLAALGLPGATGWAALFLLLQLVGIPFLALGVAGRFISLLLMAPVGFAIAAAGPAPANIIALSGCLYLLIFGTGYKSLWTPEDGILNRRSREEAVLRERNAAGDEEDV